MRSGTDVVLVAMDESRLDIGAEAYRGGTAVLFRCQDEDRVPWLYKRYKADALAQIDQLALRELVAFSSRVVTLWSELDFPRNESGLAWPQEIVTTGGQLSGVLIPEAPAPFFESDDRPRRIARLARPFGDEEYFELPQKLARIGRFYRILQWLHDHDVTIGDLQAANILVSGPRDKPAVYLVDCDSFSIRGQRTFPQLEPDMWKIEGADGRDPMTVDLAKFGLLTTRSLAEDMARFAPLDREIWKAFLASEDLTLLEKMLALDVAAHERELWNSLASVWDALDAGNGVLAYRNDDVVWARWPVDEAAEGGYSALVDKANIQSARTEEKGSNDTRQVVAGSGPRHSAQESPHRSGNRSRPRNSSSRLSRSDLTLIGSGVAAGILGLWCLVSVWGLAIASALTGGLANWRYPITHGISQELGGALFAGVWGVLAIGTSVVLALFLEVSRRVSALVGVSTMLATLVALVIPVSQWVDRLAVHVPDLAAVLP